MTENNVLPMSIILTVFGGVILGTAIGTGAGIEIIVLGGLLLLTGVICVVTHLLETRRKNKNKK